MLRRRRTPALLAASLATSILVSSATALACGGLFCSRPPPGDAPEPVDQSAERVIFVVDQGSITAHVQIQYVGDATGFAWVVPVPSVPKVADSRGALFSDLDRATAPTIKLPVPEPCPQPSFSPSTTAQGGCGDAIVLPGSTDGGAAAPNAGAAARDPVTVYKHDFTRAVGRVASGEADATVRYPDARARPLAKAAT